MSPASQLRDRRTTVDDIFDHLHSDISGLRLRPGDKISEAEVAAQFGVSRQPVRDAFSRLANLNLLLIRPQRATEVRRFSMHEIEKARFVRCSVESEVLRRAARNAGPVAIARLGVNLEEQKAAIARKDYAEFGKIDYKFHETLCDIAGVPFAFEVIRAEKAKVDRLCILSLAKEDRMPQLLDDHQKMTAAIKAGDAETAVEIGVLHLSRLDETITDIATSNADYFEPD
ncbi:GntR family transcriptional regulator [Jannaschia sp. M317]|uniref:GntR family transcriptional regulator n=1 Tax=Jannaschia sp. M317 TaxID=2867011 RepID=UPI0021A548ED|nr:GntR family transcriptional regulator [Jannaschia sp. M317]UWQ19844.1 GntR family transcriptional regulator [Jannaschia sp. M317]